MMRLLVACALLAAAALPATASDPAAIARRAAESEILPDAAGFAAASAAFRDAAAQFCAGASRAAVEAAWHGAFDAWLPLAPLRFGPVERENRAFAVAFWPDDRGAAGRALARLVTERDPAADDPAAFAAQPVSVRGLTAAELLLFDPEARGFDGENGAYRCRLLVAIGRNVAATAAAIDAEWRADAEDFAAPARADESARALLRGIATGVELDIQRLERPLGAVGKPAPRRAEAWRSGRSTRNLALSLAALKRLAATAFGPELSPEAGARLSGAFETAEAAVARIGPPLPEAVTEPQSRVRVEAAMGAVRRLRSALDETAGAAIGAPAGFNALDGD